MLEQERINLVLKAQLAKARHELDRLIRLRLPEPEEVKVRLKHLYKQATQNRDVVKKGLSAALRAEFARHWRESARWLKGNAVARKRSSTDFGRRCTTKRSHAIPDPWISAKVIYSVGLDRSRKARQFLKRWGITRETSLMFGLGYARPSLADKWRSYGLSPKALLKAGLCWEWEGWLTDALVNRLVIPIHSARGRVVGLLGRIIEPNVMPIYRGAWRGEERSLFNERAIRRGERVTVVEGVRDTLLLEQNGIRTVGLLDLLDLKQAVQALRKAKEVRICLDRDRVGSRTTKTLASRLGRRAHIVKLPQGADVAALLTGPASEYWVKKLRT